ncbi:hypothetical protein [Fructilactobacillus fructivorans]|nr:hypothetical protein [Fructilactobacillus fructivorans]
MPKSTKIIIGIAVVLVIVLLVCMALVLLIPGPIGEISNAI